MWLGPLLAQGHRLKPRMKIIIAVGLLLLSVHLGSSLLIGAFNIKAFGDSKTSNATLLNIITKVVQRYDIVVIQEVRDSDLSATNRLMQSVNGGGSPYQYQYIVSEPLGRNTYKERYLFVYRSQAVSVANSFHYDDGCESCGTDTFNREPFVVMFSSNTAVQNFAIIPQHTSPEVAVQEIDALHDVVLNTRQRLNTNNIMLLGDFNAGCSYVSSSDWSKIRLRTDQSYTWLIPDSVDTTVTTTNCPYDRIVATPDMMKGVSAGSARVFDFMQAQGLSHSWALAVSDHFPVEVTLV
ncbi:Deoxyribonuclease-1 [Labeo rohita]|uniref:Deoxyribonuclease n=2 Tax=Labeo rohita TaxID=84645 RepID=A0ABQ8MU36_LABRO|nr:Deoxyribonuclease-1 [Labeo rohita]